MHLEPLTDADAHELASALLVGSEEASGYADSLVHTSGGNPLFLEELAASVAERTADLLAGLPTTVQAIISARLDALPRRSRQVLQDAAVVGRIFWRGPLAALQGDESDLDATLDDLERRDFIRRQPKSSVLEDREFIFKHILTREVARNAPAGGATGASPRGRGVHRARIRRSRAGILVDPRAPLSRGRRRRQDRDVPDDGRRCRVPRLGQAAGDHAARRGDRDRRTDRRSRPADLRAPRPGLDPSSTPPGSPTRSRGLDWLIDEADGRNLALAHLARARAAFWVADAAHVAKHSAAAAEIAERLDDREVQGRALAQRSEAESMGGDLPTAFATWERVTATWPIDRRDGAFARSYATRALMSYWAGDYETVLKMAIEAHGLGIDASNLEAAVTSACNAGLALVGLSRHEEGISWLDRAIEFGREWEERSFRFTARGMNMRAGAIREIGDLDAARAQSEEALELAKDSGFPPAEISARLDLLFVDLMEGEAGAAERVIPGLTEALEGAKGFHQFLWSIRLMAARAEAALLAGRPGGLDLVRACRARRGRAVRAAQVRVLGPCPARPRAPRDWASGRCSGRADAGRPGGRSARPSAVALAGIGSARRREGGAR